MKKTIILMTIGLVFLAGCTGIKTVSTGLENESFLEFVGDPGSYSGGVDVKIDDKTSFRAEVNKNHADRPKGTVYKIPTGAHLIAVSYKNNVIFRKKIFISSQETKKIMLP
ncbi:MAG: hypothetical protein PHS71_08260 [Proteiniphilum sp.]|nr:hypothetical protein [Proteiniphilum sp.]MDD3969033.1 hypothetical protein [Proteiniphilum sp.]MDD4801050.1 hypothetical protein [Proteiniphilum sp.]